MIRQSCIQSFKCKHGYMEAEDLSCAAGLMKLTTLCPRLSELNFEMAATALWNCAASCRLPASLVPSHRFEITHSFTSPSPALPVGLKRELKMFHITHACAFCRDAFIISPLRSLWISLFLTLSSVNVLI